MVELIFPSLNEGTDHFINVSLSVWRGASSGKQMILTFICAWGGRFDILPLILATKTTTKPKTSGWH